MCNKPKYFRKKKGIKYIILLHLVVEQDSKIKQFSLKYIFFLQNKFYVL